MMGDVIKAHLDAVEAQLLLAQAQIAALRDALAPLFAPKATPSLDARCAGIPEGRCALQGEDGRISRASFGNPNAWKCAGCGYVGGST